MQISCPRCGAPADVEFYGPCDACHRELRATMHAGDHQPDAVAEYEPKMNVTPNAVALKDD